LDCFKILTLARRHKVGKNSGSVREGKGAGLPVSGSWVFLTFYDKEGGTMWKLSLGLILGIATVFGSIQAHPFDKDVLYATSFDNLYTITTSGHVNLVKKYTYNPECLIRYGVGTIAFSGGKLYGS
jgi:hypothetical protein